MHSIRASNKTSRYLSLLPLAILVATLGCQGSDGGASSGSTAGSGAVVNGTSGTGGGGASAGASTAGGGGSTAGGGTGGNPMSARSCDADCAALANTECAGGSFSIATCVPQCQQTAQAGIDGAKTVGCLDQYLALDKCRASDPVCTHPDPSKCVQENAAYIACLQDAAAQ
jgi:hypothetical protein